MTDIRRGYIYEIYPDTYEYKIQLYSGGFVWTPVQFRSASLDRGGGEFQLLKRGTDVDVDVEANPNKVINVCNKPGIKGANSYRRRKFLGLENVRYANSYDTNSDWSIVNGYSFGGLDGIYTWVGGQNYRDGRERSVIGGDYYNISDSGNGLSILEGGYTCLKSNDLSQIEFFKEQDAVRITSRRFEHWSDFGTFEFYNNLGDTGFFFLGSDASSPTVKDMYYFGMGKNDKGMRRYLRTKESPSFEENIDYDGNVFLKARHIAYDLDQGFSIRGSEDFSLSTKAQMALQSENSMEIKSILGAITHSSGEGFYYRSPKGTTYSMGGDMNASYGGNYVLNIGGPLIDFLISPGFGINVARGNIEFDQGNPLQGGVGSITDFKINALNGGFSYTTSLGNIKMDTLIGDLNFSTALGTANITGFTGVNISSNLGPTTLKAGNPLVPMLQSILTLNPTGIADLTGKTLTTLGGGSHPLVHGDTLLADLTEFLTQLSSGAPGSPPQNAAWIGTVQAASGTLMGKLAKWNSLKVMTA